VRSSAPSQHRDAVRYGKHLADLVGDEDQAATVGRHLPEHTKRSSTAESAGIDGDDEDDDEALDGRDEVGRDPDDRLHRCPSDQETAEKVSRQDAPQRFSPPKSATTIAVEAIVAGEPREAPSVTIRCEMLPKTSTAPAIPQHAPLRTMAFIVVRLTGIPA